LLAIHLHECDDDFESLVLRFDKTQNFRALDVEAGRAGEMYLVTGIDADDADVLHVASAQFLGQPETAIFTLVGVHEPHMNFSMRMPKPVESWVPKRHQSVPTHVLTVRRPLA